MNGLRIGAGGRAGLGAVGLLLLLAIWQASVQFHLVPPGLLPAPTELWAAFVSEVSGGFWGQAIKDSLVHYVAGLLIDQAAAPAATRLRVSRMSCCRHWRTG